MASRRRHDRYRRHSPLHRLTGRLYGETKDSGADDVIGQRLELRGLLSVGTTIVSARVIVGQGKQLPSCCRTVGADGLDQPSARPSRRSATAASFCGWRRWRRRRSARLELEAERQHRRARNPQIRRLMPPTNWPLSTTSRSRATPTKLAPRAASRAAGQRRDVLGVTVAHPHYRVVHRQSPGPARRRPRRTAATRSGTRCPTARSSSTRSPVRVCRP